MAEQSFYPHTHTKPQIYPHMENFENWYYLQRQVDILRDEVSKLKTSINLIELAVGSLNTRKQYYPSELGWGKGRDE